MDVLQCGSSFVDMALSTFAREKITSAFPAVYPMPSKSPSVQLHETIVV